MVFMDVFDIMNPLWFCFPLLKISLCLSLLLSDLNQTSDECFLSHSILLYILFDKSIYNISNEFAFILLYCLQRKLISWWYSWWTKLVELENLNASRISKCRCSPKISMYGIQLFKIPNHCTLPYWQQKVIIVLMFLKNMYTYSQSGEKKEKDNSTRST